MNKQEILQLFQKHWKDIPSDVKRVILNYGKDIGINNPGIGAFEAFLLHFQVLENNPSFVFEMGTREGSTTYAVASAMKVMNRKSSFVTTEIGSLPSQRFFKIGLSDYVEFVHGDGIKVGQKYDIDFCVIDADHTYQFAKRYIKDLFPKLFSNCFIFIHDHLLYVPGNLNKDMHKTPPGHEQRAVKEYLLESGAEYCLLHGVVGGRHLPFNTNFAAELKSITEIEFFPAQTMLASSIIMRKP